MATKNQDEIDLRYLYRKSKSGFRRMNRRIFRIIDFYARNWIIVLILIALGVGYGFYKSSNKVEAFQNRLLVVPNVENVDYLYDKIDAINKKIGSGDTLFLKTVFKANFRKVNSIKIEPVEDLYQFINYNRRNIDLIRVFGQNKDIQDFSEGVITSKNYKYHTVNVGIRGRDASEQIVSDMMDFLNKNEHYLAYFEMYRDMKAFEIKENKKMIQQLDSLIYAATKTSSSGISGVAVNTTNNLHLLVEQKDEVIQNLYLRKKEFIDYTAPIKLVNADYNIQVTRFLSLSDEVKYPLLFVGLFSLFFLLKHLFIRLRTLARQPNNG